MTRCISKQPKGIPGIAAVTTITYRCRCSKTRICTHFHMYDCLRLLSRPVPAMEIHVYDQHTVAAMQNCCPPAQGRNDVPPSPCYDLPPRGGSTGQSRPPSTRQAQQTPRLPQGLGFYACFRAENMAQFLVTKSGPKIRGPNIRPHFCSPVFVTRKWSSLSARRTRTPHSAQRNSWAATQAQPLPTGRHCC